VCGIAGVISLEKKVDRSLLEKASRLMIHRGPDDEGFFVQGPVGLAHRRLSIIDLAGGAQPMFNEDHSLVIVFNGEIYNFIDLRSELQSNGHHFATSSDTEVILHSYEEWGTDCVEKFHGMFAFAVYNRKEKSLFLSRDRCGEKPLYYFHNAKGFFFASEIKTLLELLRHTPSPDSESIYLYLRLGYIPAPRTFYRGVKKLQAGSSMLFEEGQLKKWSHYEPRLACVEGNESEQELCEELDTRLTRAVKKMLISDVPLGAFLSGGLDSSLIVALMAKSGDSPRTFSISFDDESFDESHYAMLVARHVGTKHTHYKVSFDDFDSCLSLMQNFGEPFADSSGIPTFYLARETRKRVKVALSGDGGDELFGGYRRYLAQNLAKYYLLIPAALRKGLIKRLVSVFPEGDKYYADNTIKSARIFVERVESSRFGSLGLMLNTVFSHHEVVELFPDLPNGQNLMEEHVERIQSEDLEALMYADRLLYLPDDILVKVDRMTMKCSLEVRAPYLDPEVLSLSERIPLSLKVRGKHLKYLLKKVALKYLPPQIVYRKKHGFMVPMAKWIKMAGEEDMRRRMPTWVNSVAADKLLMSHLSGRFDNSQKIFALIMLGCYSDRVIF
jgi:asparagine synthase (glutamine-hydrolysing)